MLYLGVLQILAVNPSFLESYGYVTLCTVQSEILAPLTIVLSIYNPNSSNLESTYATPTMLQIRPSRDHRGRHHHYFIPRCH